MRIAPIIFLILVSMIASAQKPYDSTKISERTKYIINLISSYNIVEADSMGIHASPLPPEYPTTLLRKKVPLWELTDLTSHPNPVVRSHAFRALGMISEREAFKIVVEHLNDTAMIESVHGCFAKTESVGDFFVGIFYGYEIKERNVQHLKTLDSLIVVTPNRLSCRGEAANRLAADEVYYPSIRKLALEDGLYKALISLAKFQKPQDVDALLNAEIKDGIFKNESLNSRFMIIRAFPHPAFLPFVEQHLRRELSGITRHGRYVYMALVNFSGTRAHGLLLKPFAIKDPEQRKLHLKALNEALGKVNNPEFTDIRKKLAAEQLN